MAHSDSPASQLIQRALAPAAQSQEHSREWSLASPNDGNTAINFSLDSRIIPARPLTPRYHLRVPSLQSPEGSVLAQNENQHQKNSEITLPAPPESTGPVQLGSDSEFFRHGDSPITAPAKVIVLATRTTSLQSPPTAAPARLLSRPTKTMPVGNRQYCRSPSLPSQDSFGGPVSQDPAELYLATAKPFNVPLSDLGEMPTQRVSHSPADPGMTLPDASEHKEFLEAAMREYEAQRASKAPSNDRVNILVAATPSNSGDSSSMSQPKDYEFSFRDHGPEFPRQESRFEFDGPSSFDKMLDRDLVDAPDQTPEHTQPKEVQPTQVDAVANIEPFIERDPPTPLQASKQHSLPFEWIGPVPSATIASSNPRSLLRMVHPRNQYRIAMMRHLAGDVDPPSCVDKEMETQPSRVEETQRCHVDDGTYSNALQQARSAPLQTKVAGSRQTMHQPREGVEDDEPEDALDVVPDSEPLRAGPSNQSPSHHLVVCQRSLRKPFRSCSPISEQGSGDLVPDSLEVEESEADVPLAVEVSLKKAKTSVTPAEDEPLQGGKTRTASTVAAKAALLSLEKQRQKPISSYTKGKGSRAKPSKVEHAEVPTSLPEQDLQDQAPSPGRAPANLTNLPPSKQKTRRPQHLVPLSVCPSAAARPPVIKPVTGKKRSHKSDTESAEESLHCPTKNEGSTQPKAQKEEEEETESAGDPEVDSLPSPPPRPDASRKRRKRTEDVNPTRGTSKASTSTRNKRSETPAVAARSVKRLRSGVSSTRGLTAESATRVFALWKQDGHYYSGVLHSRGLKNKYLVKFDDGTEDEVELKNMRHRDLLVGDRVIFRQDNIKGVVSDVTHADSHGWFILEIDNGEAVSTIQAGFDDICLANRTIQSQWKARTVVPEAIVTLVRPRPPIDVTPSKRSVTGTTPIKIQRELIKTGFVVTINPKNNERMQTKDEAMHAIKQRGGLVIEDWSSVFTMEGKHCQSNKRWIATPQDFRWKSERNLDRVFLLSDDAHQKPKFLLALALGIPCLSFDWVTKEGELSSDWQQFLLPAGYSDLLGARISQLVDLDWGNCTEHLMDIMSSRVPIRLFSEKTVLCVGSDLVPLPPNRARKSASEEPSRCVPWVILCMGATKVEAVTDTKQVSASHMQTFDYIIVKEQDVLGSVEIGEGVTVGDINWVKDCLVAGRLFPPGSD